jgi:hypothetical protein
MKRALIALTLAAAVALSGCAGSLRTTAATYKPYGFFNENEVRQPNVKYQLSAGSVIVALLFSETFFVPLYIIGWDLFEPVSAS